MKKTILIGILLMALLVLTACYQIADEESPMDFSGEASDYVGTWERAGTYTDGEQVSSASATLEFTETTFSSTSEACSNSGSILVQESTMMMTVEESDCPSIIGVGSTTTSTYEVRGAILTLINNEYGAEVKEVYTAL